MTNGRTNKGAEYLVFSAGFRARTHAGRMLSTAVICQELYYSADQITTVLTIRAATASHCVAALSARHLALLQRNLLKRRGTYLTPYILVIADT